MSKNYFNSMYMGTMDHTENDEKCKLQLFRHGPNIHMFLPGNIVHAFEQILKRSFSLNTFVNGSFMYQVLLIFYLGNIYSK